MNEIRALLETSVARILGDRWDDRAARAADGAWAAALWEALDALGPSRLLVSEELGGAGLSFADGLGLLRFLGTHASPVPLPIAETMLAGYFLAQARIDLPDTPMTIGASRPGEAPRLREVGGRWVVSGKLRRVPWARDVPFAVVAARIDDEDAVALVAIAGGAIEPGSNLAGEPRDDVCFEEAPVEAVARHGGAIGRMMESGAAARTAQIAAACRMALAMTVDHANSRQQFGRAIGKFQAVQQNLAVMAGQAAAAAGAADLAADALDGRGSSLGVAFGKARASAAAGTVAALAHQTIAAIGFAEEHGLHRITKRLLSWRDEMGPEGYWARQVGEQAFAGGGDRFWRLVSGT